MTVFLQRPLALALAFSACAQAEDIETIHVVARAATPLAQQPAAVTVIEAEQIEQRGYANLADVLRNQPAIQVSNSGGLGKASSLRIRGEEGYRTKVLVDGMDLADPTATQVQAQVQHVDVAGFERIEILRGPQGLVYGADAGGVISASSKPTQAGDKLVTSVELGRYGYQRLQGKYSHRSEQAFVSLSASDLDSDGFNARTIDAGNETDGYENTSFHLATGYQINEQLSVEAVLRDVDADAGFDGFSASSDHDNNSHFEQQAARLALDYQAQGSRHSFAYHRNQVERENTVLSTGARTYLAEGMIETLQYNSSWEVSDKAQLIFGLEREQQQDDANHFERDQDGVYLAFEGELIDALYLSAGLRYDDNEDFGSHTSYRLGVAYDIALSDSVLTLKGAYGAGFRAPSLFEVYNPYYGNPALTEEQSQGGDIGLAWRNQAGTKAELVYFYQEVEDLIEYVWNSSGGNYAQTQGVAVSKGVELQLHQQLGQALALHFNATYNDAHQADGKQRIRRPRVLANLGLDYDLLDGQVTLSGNLRHASRQRDFGANLAEHQVLDIKLSWQATPELAFFTRVENALDEEYREAAGYNTARAAAYAGVRLQF
ncbi:MAG: TonB-dependent receptor [Cellvibrionaceae bacterium]|nr:TonB-dependent receptor [Cellvibrionaceae bacterium]